MTSKKNLERKGLDVKTQGTDCIEIFSLESMLEIKYLEFLICKSYVLGLESHFSWLFFFANLMKLQRVGKNVTFTGH